MQKRGNVHYQKKTTQRVVFIFVHLRVLRGKCKAFDGRMRTSELVRTLALTSQVDLVPASTILALPCSF